MSRTFLIQDGDLVKDAAGQFVICTGSTKRDLDVANSLLTPLDSDRPEGAFGNEFLGLLGNETLALPGNRLLAAHITEAIERLQALQRLDDTITEDEQIREIVSLEVAPLAGEAKTSFIFLLRLKSEAGDTSTIAKNLSFGHHNVPDGYVER